MRKNHAAGRLQVHHRRRRGRRARPHPVHRRRHAARRGRLGRHAATCWRSPTTIAELMAEPKVVVDKSTVPVGTADKVRGRHRRGARRAAARRPRLRRGLEPGVPQGGRRGRRLHAPRPHRHRHLRPGVRGPAARGLRPVQPQPRQDHRDGRALGRADQVRGQLHARDQDQLHERDGQPRRAARRRRRDGAPGHRLGPAHRLPLHLPRRRLRRLVLPQGREGADPHRPRGRLRAHACCRRSRTATTRRRR